ncbi:MAG: aminotransferase class V-fold PLP-dependent enzyme [Myxococcales bacterium]|nr:aminotransferase class V-fold PLP-dependent enzyme [Myxococcales bacterium]
MATLKDHWTLDPKTRFLNHGSFGACPRVVLDAQRRWQDQMERQPVRFFMTELPPLLDAARARVAALVDAPAEDLAFVTNATTGVNTVLRALRLGPGDALLATDHTYQACRRSLEFIAAQTGAALQIVAIPFPGTTADGIVEAVLGAVTPQTRVALLDHVTSQTGLVFPIERLVKALDDRGVDALVDGAHAPGMVPVSLRKMQPAWYTANLHKWCCAPKGAALLYVRPDRRRDLHPLNISHGYVPGGDLRAEFDWTGTWDPTAWLTVPAALDFLDGVGGLPAIQARNRALALTGRDHLLRVLGIPAPAADDLIGSMAAVPLPPAAGAPLTGLGTPDAWQRALLADHGIEVPIIAWPAPPRRVLRISAQLYNHEGEYLVLASALGELLAQAPREAR